MQVIKSRLQDAQTKNKLPVYSLDDLKKVGLSQLKGIDPTRLNLGTEVQDAMLVAQAFEKGAHYTPTEVAVFAPLNRHLSNYRHISKNMKKVLGSYVMVPENSLSQHLLQTEKLAKEAGVSISQTDTGKGRGTQEFSQSLNTGQFQQSVNQPEGFGDQVRDWLQDCVPCDLRISSWLELNPNVNLIDLMEASMKGMQDFLNGIANMLRNLDVFGDFCALMDLFNFTCIPDLQRILMLLSTLLAFEMPDLGGLLGLVQILIAPLLSPILNALLGLFDQFKLLVANPLECIVDAINMQIQKLPRADNPFFRVGNTGAGAEAARVAGEVQGELKSALGKTDPFVQGMGTALETLRDLITETISMIQAKMELYLGDLRALIGDMASIDASYVGKSMKKLQIIRLISFITALIQAISSGSLGFCKGERSAEAHEIDTFFNDYLGPNMAFAVSVDNDGNLKFVEKRNNPLINRNNPLINRENVIEFEGENIVGERAMAVARNLTEPVQVVKPCRLQVKASEAETLNKYMTELNSL